MKLLNALGFIACFALSACVSDTSANGSAKGRTVGFSANCPMPPGSLKRSGSTYTFELEHGDVGGCSVDAQARHGAPYWERAEVKSGDLQTGRTYEITFDVNFDPDTISSNRTNFFQMHTYNQACTECVPAFMMRAYADGRLGVDIFNAARISHDRWIGSRSSMAGRWTPVRIIATTNTGTTNRLEIFIDGKQVLSSTAAYIAPQGKPHLKMGLYRPGSSSQQPTDRVSIRNVRTRTIGT